MNRIVELLRLPGVWLFDAFMATGIESDGEARLELAPMLATAFWLAILFILVVVRRYASGSRLTAADFSGPRLRTLWRRYWGFLWRAQVVHTCIFWLLPVAYDIVRLILEILSLPFSLLSFGNTNRDSASLFMQSVSSPNCWTFLTICRPSAYFSWGASLAGKFVWLAITAVWVRSWLRRTHGETGKLPAAL